MYQCGYLTELGLYEIVWQVLLPWECVIYRLVSLFRLTDTKKKLVIITITWLPFYRAIRYAGAVYVVVVYLSVYPSVPPSRLTSQYCIETIQSINQSIMHF